MKLQLVRLFTVLGLLFGGGLPGLVSSAYAGPAADNGVSPPSQLLSGCTRRGADERCGPTQTPSPGATSPAPVPTSTSLPPPALPTSTPLVGQPTRTSPGSIEPFAAAPLCPTHGAGFHTLWDAVRGCHYDHSHGTVDPHSLDGVFGTQVWSWFTSGELSFPWATSATETHGDYVWLVGTASTCFSQFGDGCFTHWRALVHNDFHNARTRYHSYFIEARVCSEASPSRCGTFAMAGWHDTGDLLLDGVNVLPVDQSSNRAPRAQKLHYTTTGNVGFGTWYPVSPAGWSRIATEVGDMPGHYTAPAPEVGFIFACQQAAGCARNGSRIQTHVLGLTITSYLRRTFGLTPNADNRLTTNTLVDRYGYPAATGCQRGGLDCLPLYVNGVPAEVVSFQYRGADYMEMDLYFNGQPSGWALPLNLR